MAVGGLDDDGGWRRRQTRQEGEDARAGFLEGAACGVFEGEREIDHGEVDGGLAEHAFGLAGRAGAEGVDADGLEEGGEAVGPGLAAPVGGGQEEVESATGEPGGWTG